MNLLAIDASTELSSVALTRDGKLFCEELSTQKTHAQLLLPMIDSLLKQAGTEVGQLDGIVFGCGPGSFTGLRIACSIAKGLAYAHQLSIFPVSCLAAIAYSVRIQHPNSSVLSVLDARMNELYWGYFASNALFSEDKVNAAVDIVIPEDTEIILAGVGLDMYWNDLSDKIKAQTSNKITLYPNAVAMIELVQQGAIKPVLVTDAQPVYVRNQVTQGESGG